MKAYLTYFGYFGWLLLLYYISVKQRYFVTKQEHVDDKTVTRYNWAFALLAVAPLIYMTATRGYIGDTINYRKSFLETPLSFSAIPSYVQTLSKDQAYYAFAAVMHTILGDRPVVYFGIVAIIQVLCMTKTLRKYSPYLLTAFFIFVASTDYLSYMQNGIRQFIAVCIIFACSDWIFQKKYVLAVLSVIVAAQFHQSALLMIPVIFIVQGKPWNKSTVFFMFVALTAVFFVDRFTDILDSLLSETQYSNVVSDWTSWSDNGTNPLRVLVYCVPMIGSLICLPYIREADDPMINVCVNMSVITAGLYLISMVTSGVFIGRLPIYTALYSNCILLPWEIEHSFSKDSAKLIRFVMFVAFLFFYYYQIHFTWSMI